MVAQFDNARYFFGNISEGTQRSCIEYGIRTARMKELFLSGKTEWQNTGGLFGLVLSLAETLKVQQENQEHANSKSKKAPEDPIKTAIGIHGGDNILHTLATGRRFIFRTNTPLTVHEMDTSDTKPDLGPHWEDGNLRVWKMKIYPSSVSHTDIAPEYQTKRKFDNEQRRRIVSLMFDSDWRNDSLMEVPLGECQVAKQIFIRKPDSKGIELYKGPLPGSVEADPALKVLTRRPWPGATVGQLPPAQRETSSMCYIAKSHPRRGAFDPKKAIELGVKPGPDFGKLAGRMSVQTKDGNVVTPEMVLEPDRIALGFAVINIPTVEYVDDLINRPEWNSEDIMEGLELISWQLGEGVYKDPRIQAFCEKFPPNVRHFISSPDYCPNRLTFSSVARMTTKLAELAPDQFKVPVHDNVSAVQRQNRSLLASGAEIPKRTKFISAVPGLLVRIAPKLKVVSESAAQPLNTAEVLEGLDRKARNLGRAARARIKAKLKQQVQPALPGEDAQIITLGTGSSSPSKYRNLSGTLLRVPGSGSYLLDCGEGTLGQLKRAFEPEELYDILRDLKMIWISHLHADHHLGTISLIRAWHEAVHGSLQTNSSKTVSTSHCPQAPEEDQSFSPEMPWPTLAIVSHEDMLTVLREYSTAENFGLDKCILLSAVANSDFQLDLTHQHPGGTWVRKTVPASDPKIYQHCLGLKDLKFCRVSHCYGAMAVSLEFEDGFKVSYSGDCRPSQRFAEIGAGSTVLIHEATFDDELHNDACAKKHSTSSEAIGVAAAMGAKTLLLTHFSQRYAKLPEMSKMNTLKVNFEDAASGPPVENELVTGASEGLELQPSALREVMDGGDPGVLSIDGIHGEGESVTTSTNGGATLSTYVDSAMRSTVVTAVAPSDLKVCVAFDYMRIRVGDIWKMEQYTQTLTHMFGDPREHPGSDSGSDTDPSAPQGKREIKGSQKNQPPSSNPKSTKGASPQDDAPVDTETREPGKRCSGESVTETPPKSQLKKQHLRERSKSLGARTGDRLNNGHNSGSPSKRKASVSPPGQRKEAMMPRQLNTETKKTNTYPSNRINEAVTLQVEGDTAHG